MAADVGIIATPKFKVLLYGEGGMHQTDQLTVDVTNFTRNQVIGLLRTIATTEIQAQERIGNPPDIIIADNQRGKSASTAVRRIEATFGLRLLPAALAVMEDILRKCIAKATQRRTGTLMNMGNWRWVYVRDGKGQAVPIGNRAGIPLAATDALVLRPERVPYSTVANIAVATQRRSRAVEKRIARGKGDPRRARGIGFLADATRTARRHPVFAGFNVAVRFTGHAVPGERWRRKLTGTILITPKTGRRALTRSRRR